MEKNQARSWRVVCDVTYDVKKCSSTLCVHVNDTCPSEPFVYSFRHDGLSVTLVVTIATMCTLICVLVVIGVCILRTHRQKTNTLRDYQSVSEPFRKSYITSDTDRTPTDYMDVYKPRKTTFYRKCDETNNGLINAKQCESDNNDFKIIFSPRLQNDTEQSKVNATTLQSSMLTNQIRTCSNEYVGNSVIEKKETCETSKECATDVINKTKSRTSEMLGKYTFKPRLKYTNCNQILDVDKTERDKLFVINSYKHCSGKSILPTTLTFDKDSEQFSSKFANDLLCSSTPRPPAKHLTLEILSKSIESVDCEV